jgi:hypothetical protein
MSALTATHKHVSTYCYTQKEVDVKQILSIAVTHRLCLSITDWNQLPEGTIGTSHGKTHIFKTRVRKVKTSEGN